MNRTSKIFITAVTAVMISCLTACNVSTSTMTIPAVNETNIEEAADTLGLSVEKFETFLENIEISYDDYIANLNKTNQTLDDLKAKIEENYSCSFEEYVDTVITVNNKEIPDEGTYCVFKSKYSVFDSYISNELLNDNELIDYAISIEIAEDSSYAVIFDAMQAYSGDLRRYFDLMNTTYGCTSVELSNICMFGGHGSKKPDESNSCMDDLFVYDSNTNEILEKLIVPVVTLHFEDKNNNISLALSDELGLLFKSTGANSNEKLLKLSNLSFQIRKANHTE